MNWNKYSEVKPPEVKKLYRWRVSPRMILGLELQPEWTEELSHLMGRPEELFPPTGHWNGFRVEVEPTLEWRECLENENTKKAPITWNGLDLLPCPFTGEVPNVKAAGGYMGCPPYKCEYLVVEAAFNNSRWDNAKNLMNCWNKRA